jgi:hypothetical protein
MYIINLQTGIVIRESDSKQVAPASSTSDPDYIAYIEWIAAGNTPTEVSVPIAETSKITKLAFRNRFTTAEKVALEMASIDNPSGTPQERQLQAALRVYLKDLDNATYVDLARTDTQYGVQQLAGLGLITSARATTILTSPIQPYEIPGG